MNDLDKLPEPGPRGTDPERFAPDGFVWQCGCGKISPVDRYGDTRSSYGWDASCVLNSVLVKEGK